MNFKNVEINNKIISIKYKDLIYINSEFYIINEIILL